LVAGVRLMRGAFARFLSILFAFLLGACAALLRSSKTMNSALAVTRAGYLELGCFKGKPSVGFAFAFDVGSTKDSEFGYRFDAKPGRQISPRFLSKHKTIVIEAKADVEQFAAELTASNVLLYFSSKSGP